MQPQGTRAVEVAREQLLQARRQLGPVWALHPQLGTALRLLTAALEPLSDAEEEGAPTHQGTVDPRLR
jgi:hypothetical protein